jgi:hypothetical protein
MEEDGGHMSESYWWDSLDFGESDTPIIDPDAQAALLAQPAEIATYENDDGDIVTEEFSPTFVSEPYTIDVPDDPDDPDTTYTQVEVMSELSWDPDDEVIAVDRANQDVPQIPFRDPVQDTIIAGGS